MFRFVRDSLRTRFILGVAAMLLPLALLGVGAFLSLQSVTGALEEVVNEMRTEKDPIMHLQIALLNAAMPPNDFLIHGDPAERMKFARLTREVDRAIEAALAAPFGLPEERELLRSALEEWRRARLIAESLLTSPRPAGSPAAAREMERMDAHIDRAVDFLHRLHDLSEGEIQEDLTTAAAVERRESLLVVAMFGMGMVIALGIGHALARSILRPVRQLEVGARRLSAGDLSHRVDLSSKDELGLLARTFNAMAEELEKSHAVLQNLSIRDGLTGLYNHREFQRRLKEEMERSRRYGRTFSLLMMDIDHFKVVNDTYGHPAGDKVLRAVADVVRREVRFVDHVARYGGEEFAVILPETHGAGVLVAAERLRTAAGDHAIAIPDGPEINVTVSIGIAEFPWNAGSMEELIAAADRALYSAKQTGRNRVCAGTASREAERKVE